MPQQPKELLEQMCAGADPRKERSLRLIYGICEEQKKRGSKDYSVATIGRLSQESEGPSAASIRNKTGECYRAIIQAFAKSAGGRIRKSSDPRPSDVDIVLEGITDPVLRTRVGLLLAELTATRAQLIAARHLANIQASLDLEKHNSGGVESESFDQGAVFTIQHQPQAFTTLEVRALKAAISQETLEHWGWRVDDAGRVLSQTDQQVFSAGFVPAIRKVLNTIQK